MLSVLVRAVRLSLSAAKLYDAGINKEEIAVTFAPIASLKLDDETAMGTHVLPTNPGSRPGISVLGTLDLVSSTMGMGGEAS